MRDQNIKPGRWYYGLAVLVFIIGCLLFGLLLFKKLNGLMDGLTRITVPAETDITFSQPGTYTVFYEYQSFVGNKLFYTEKNLAGLECTIVSQASGSRIPLSPTSIDLEYSFAGRKGVSVLEFTIEEPGIYEFSCPYPEGKSEIVLAIGQGLIGKFVRIIVGGIAIFFISAAIGVALALRTFFKRKEMLNRR